MKIFKSISKILIATLLLSAINLYAEEPSSSPEATAIAEEKVVVKQEETNITKQEKTKSKKAKKHKKETKAKKIVSTEAATDEVMPETEAKAVPEAKVKSIPETEAKAMPEAKPPVTMTTEEVKVAEKAKMILEKSAPELDETTDAEDALKLQEALIVMAKKGDIKSIKHLIKSQKIDLTKPGKYNMTPLLAAAKAGQYKTCKFLAKKGANVQDTSENGFDGLRFAVENNDLKVAKFFLKRGVKPDNQDYIGDTSLMITLTKNNEALIKLLAKKLKNIKLNLKNRDGKTILMMAVENNDVKLVKKLLKYDANIWLLDNKGHDALSYAENDNNKKIMEILKEEIDEARKKDPKVERWVRKPGSIN